MNKKVLALIITLAVSGAQIYCNEAEATEVETANVEQVTPTEETTAEKTVAETVAQPEIPALTPEEEKELEEILNKVIQAQIEQQEAQK